MINYIKAFILACKLYGKQIGHDEDENPVYIEWESAWDSAKLVHIKNQTK